MGRLIPKDDTVRFDVFASGGLRILVALAHAARQTAWDWRISCGTEGHPPTDPHSRGEAYDLSLATFPDTAAIVAAYHDLKADLGAAFTVLFEVPYLQTDSALASIAYVNADATARHFHIQVRKGTTYSPPIQEGTKTV